MPVVSKAWNWLKKNRFFILLGAVLLVGTFLRSVHFSDWLHFELDQSRDALVVKEAWEKGPGYLPLLGPRAAGTFLRLGPAEYYFQYLSAVIFNSTQPWVLAYPALLFSVLSILVFYFLIKNFFSSSVSLLATASYAFSFILIQYARFAWNPNGIPFWGLLFILSIYKARVEENRKRAGLWLCLSAISYGVVSQLHFLALVGFPLMAGFFWIFYFPKKIKLRFWVGSLALLSLIYLPMFLSELSTKGDNLKQFQYALTAKTKISQGESSWGKAGVVWRQTAISFSMLTTSFGHKDSQAAFYFGTGLILGGALYAFWLARKDGKKRLLLWLILCWLGAFFFLYIKTDTSLKPRFFFPIAAVPFLFLAYLLDLFLAFNRRKKFSYFLIIGLVGSLVGANLEATKQAYAFLRTSDDSVISRKMFLKQSGGVTLESLRSVAGYMAETAQKNNKTVCYDGLAEYKRSLDYFLDNDYSGISRARITGGMSEKDKRNCQFFSFAQKKTNRIKMSGDNGQYFQGTQVFTSGALAVWSLSAKEEFFSNKKLETKEGPVGSPETDDEGASISEEESLLPEETAKSEAEKNQKPRRKERVYWKDLFLD